MSRWTVAAATTAFGLLVAGGIFMNYRRAHDFSTPLSLTDGFDILLYACVFVGAVSIGILILRDAAAAETGSP